MAGGSGGGIVFNLLAFINSKTKFSVISPAKALSKTNKKI
jgi:hypothetical protein